MTLTADESVVLTGCGWVTPFAAGSIADILTSAEAGIATPSSESGYWAVPDDRLADYPAMSNELKRNKGAWLAAAALEHACRSASFQIGSPEADRVGLALGCGLAGQFGMIEFANEVRQQSPRFVSPIHFPQTVGNYIAGALARGYDIRGPNVTLASGPASALDAIIEACAVVARGGADVVYAGGTEQLSKAVAEGLGRSDPVLSEGACFFVVERLSHATARGVRPLATVARWHHLDERAAGFSPCGVTNVRESAQAKACGSGGIVSVAGCRCGGAIFIEHWIGHCIGACGAAAMAAAIGAVDGCTVPLIDPSNLSSITVGRIVLENLRTSDGSLQAMILAESDGIHLASLELVL